MKTVEMFIDEIRNNKEIQKKLAEAAKNNTIADLLKEMGFAGTSEKCIADEKRQNGELGEDELDAVVGGTNGYNPGWAYGPCQKCDGTRYVMQLDYKNIIACPFCGDWVEF